MSKQEEFADDKIDFTPEIKYVLETVGKIVRKVENAGYQTKSNFIQYTQRWQFIGYYHNCHYSYRHNHYLQTLKYLRMAVEIIEYYTRNLILIHIVLKKNLINVQVFHVLAIFTDNIVFIYTEEYRRILLA